VDDPIATALREAQRELRKVVATNKARKARLISIACDRLGYQEYLEVRDSIDKNITTLCHKLQRKDVPKVLKKKKKPLQGAAAAGSGGAGAGEDTGTGLLPQCPAALGLTQDDENHLSVNEQLMQLVETRRQWVDSVGAVFDAKERETPGRLYGLPKRSVFEGIEEEVRAMLAAPSIDVNDFNSSINGTIASSSANGGRNQGGSSKISSNNSYGGVSLSNGKGKERARSDAMDIG
jgi:transcriptional adapter 3